MAEDYSQYANNISNVGNIGGRVERAKRKALDIKPAERGAKVSDVQNVTKNLNKVLMSLNQFVKNTGSALRSNAEQITAAARDSAKQYSQAVKEDVRVDKQNLVATALSSASPIFGYFASKFMETDIWQKFAGTVKEKLTSGLKQGIDKAKEYSKTLLAPITEKLRGLFNKITSVFGSIGSGIKSLIPGLGGGKGTEIPKLAKGGYIGDTGLAKIHPAEVVAPSEQILKQMRKTAVSSAKAQEGIVEKLNRNFRNFVELQRERAEQTSQQFKLMRQQMGGRDRESSIKQFFTDFKKFYQGRTEEDLSIQRQTLNAVNMIRNTLVSPVGGILESLKYAFNNFLFNHPIFRSLYRFTRTAVSAAFRIPGAILRIRGNYQAQMRGVGGTPMERTAMILGMLYPPLLHKLDQIILELRGEQEGKTGWRIAGAPIRVIQSMLQGGKKGLAEDKAQAQRKGGSVPPIGAIGGGVGGMAKGIGEELGLGRPARWLKEKTEGMTAAGRERQQERRRAEVRNKFEPIPSMLEELQRQIQPMTTFYQSVTPWEILGPNGISWNLEAIKDQSKKTSKGIKDVTNEAGITARRVRKVGEIASNTEQTAEYTHDTREATETVSRRLGWQSMVRMIGMIGSTMSSVFSTVTSTITSAISTAATTISAAVAGKSMMGGGGAGRGILGRLGNLGKRGLSKIGGAKGLLKGGGILSAGLTAYEGIKGAMSPSKMMKGVKKGEVGAQERTAAATGAILGGKGKGGLGQAAGQAAKWGSIGAAGGSIIPGVGTAIGGGAGALAGGIMGLIGGDRIASATNSLIEGSKSMVGSVASSITSIFKNTKEKEKEAKEKTKEQSSNLLGSMVKASEKIRSWTSVINPMGWFTKMGADEKMKKNKKEVKEKSEGIISSIPYIGDKISSWTSSLNPMNWFGGEKEKSIDKKVNEKAKQAKKESDSIMNSISNIGSKVTSWIGSLDPSTWFGGGKEEKGKEKGFFESVRGSIPFIGGEKEKEKTPGEKAVERKERNQVVNRVMGTARNITPKQEDISKEVEEVTKSPTLDKNKIATLKNFGVNLENKEVKEVVNKLYKSTEDLKKMFAESAKSNNALIQNAMTNMQSSQSNTQQNNGGGSRRSTVERDSALERVYNGDVY